MRYNYFPKFIIFEHDKYVFPTLLLEAIGTSLFMNEFNYYKSNEYKILEIWNFVVVDW